MMSKILRIQIRSLRPIRARGFSSLYTTYSSFPASLLRYNASQKFGLYDSRKRHEKEDEPIWDGIEVSQDGLVKLGVSKKPLPCQYRGAMLMPNTFTMQENIRTQVDYYYDDEDLGKEVTVPFIYTIQKGTPVPSNLRLFRGGLSTFWLQPSQPISVDDLNSLLDEFYDKFAEKKTAEQWLDENEFNSAVGDDAVEVWMSR